MELNFKLDQAGVNALNKRLLALFSKRAEAEILGEWAALAVAFARAEVPRKTGNLFNTIRIDKVDAIRQEARIAAGGMGGVGYAAYIEFGTKEHIIVPKRARVLAWGGSRRLSGNLRSGSSPTNFAKRVRHPGTKAQPYLKSGASKALERVGLADGIIDVWNGAA